MQKRGVDSVPPEFSGKWGSECLNTRFPPSTGGAAIQRNFENKYMYMQFGVCEYLDHFNIQVNKIYNNH